MPFLFLSLVLAGGPLLERLPQAGTQTARISGRVVEDGTNAPLSGARVTVYAIGGPPVTSFPPLPPQTTTDEFGRYVFDGLPPGRYRLNAQKGGFAPQLPPDPSAFRSFDLAAGQSLDGVDISLQRGAVIAGQILDPSSGAPLADAVVTAMKRFGGGAPAGVNGSVAGRLMPAGASVQTNDLGEFRIFGLPPGEYFVAAILRRDFGLATNFADGGSNQAPRAPATGAVLTFYPGTPDALAAQPVTLAAGQVATNIDIRLVVAQTYRVSGVLVDENAAPVAGAMVMLRGDPRASDFFAGPIGQSRSDASGAFVFDGVPSGSYTAIASMPVRIGGQDSGIGAGGFSFIDIGGGAARSNQLDVTVNDANVEGLQIVVQRPQ
jgi:hypothetical protein